MGKEVAPVKTLKKDVGGRVRARRGEKDEKGGRGWGGCELDDVRK